MSELIRCFFAIPLPSQLKEEIDHYLEKLRGIYPKIKWVRGRSLHITLKFLGNIKSVDAEKALIQAMSCSDNIANFSIRVGHIGAFPNKNTPRVIWLGIQSHPHQPLYILQQTLEGRLAEIGIEREGRRFSPHLTLGRIKRADDLNPLWHYVDQHPFPVNEFPVKEMQMLRSILKPAGAEYHILQKYPLRRSG